ncbi:hypothetical protein BJV77DRAFT_1101720 [Russula vinacea]|nr:hypothetical protein BJV77DRAFT_1101720 [Russula vinacea]
MVTTFEIPKAPSSQLKTVLDYLDLVKALDLAEIDKLFTDDFVQSTSPLALACPRGRSRRTSRSSGGYPNSSREDISRCVPYQWVVHHRPRPRRFPAMTVYDIVEAPSKAWVHLLLHVEFPDGRTFDIECIYQFALVEHLASHKIKAINDFVDTAAFAALCGIQYSTRLARTTCLLDGWSQMDVTKEQKTQTVCAFWRKGIELQLEVAGRAGGPTWDRCVFVKR